MAESTGTVAIRGFNIFDPSSWVPTFGYWGGPGWSAGQRIDGQLSETDKAVATAVLPGPDGLPPPSPVDQAAKIHDLDYNSASGQPNEALLKLQADLVLMQSMAQMNWSSLNAQEAVYASMISLAFATKMAAIDTTDVVIQGIKNSIQTLAQQIIAEGGDPAGKTYTDSEGNQITATRDEKGNIVVTAMGQDGQTASATRLDSGYIEFNLAGPQAEGTLSIDPNGKKTLTISGNGFEANVHNVIVKVQPGTQATIKGDGSYVLGLPNSTVQTTTFPTTLVTSMTNSTLVATTGMQLTNLGSNNNLVLGPNTTLSNLGNNNTIIGPVPPNTTDSGSGNTSLDPENLPLGTTVALSSSMGFSASIDEDNVVHVSAGGSDGGEVDGTPVDPDPGAGGGGGGWDDLAADPRGSFIAFVYEIKGTSVRDAKRGLGLLITQTSPWRNLNIPAIEASQLIPVTAAESSSN